MKKIYWVLIHVLCAMVMAKAPQPTLERDERGNPVLSEANWQHLAALMWSQNPKLSGRDILSMIDGLEMRLSFTNRERSPSQARIRAAVMDALQGKWNAYEHPLPAAMANEFTIRNYGGTAKQMVALFLAPSEIASAEAATLAQAFRDAYNAGDANSYVSQMLLTDPLYPAYGVNYGNRPNYVGAMTSTVFSATGAPRQFSAGSMGRGTTAPRSPFDILYRGKPEHGDLHQAIPPLFEQFYSYSDSGSLALVHGALDPCHLAVNFLTFVNGRGAKFKELPFYALFAAFRRWTGDVAAEVTALEGLSSIYEQYAPADGAQNAEPVQEVITYRKSRTMSLLSSASRYFTVSKLDDICQRLVTDPGDPRQ